MIKYKLICKNCQETFDSWFASSKEYEKLKKKNFLSCHCCDSKNVIKTLMAPKLMNKSSNTEEMKKTKFNEIEKKIKEYQKFIKQNFEYVGSSFTYEARALHYNKKKNKKNIFGKASAKDIKELKEEGIETTTIPWIEDRDN